VLRFPAGENDFSLFRSVQTGFWAHPASYTTGIGGSFPCGKAGGGGAAGHSRPSSAEAENDAGTPPLPNASSWRGV
jgi:hypothetical protein